MLWACGVVIPVGPFSRRQCKDAAAVTRELKLALIVGFVLVLLVVVLVSDHLSKSRKDQLAADVPLTPALAPIGDPMLLGTAPTTGNLADVLGPATGNGLPGGLPVGGDQFNAPLAGNTPSEPLTLTMGNTPVNTNLTLPGMMDVTPMPVVSQTNPPVMNTGLNSGTASNGNSAAVIDPLVTPASAPSPSAMSGTAPSTELGNGMGGGLGGAPTTLPADVTIKPFVTPAPVTPAPTPVEKTEKAESKATTTEERWHTVQSGDSAYKIAKTYYGSGSAWKKLASYNNGRINADGSVKVGVRIKLPPAEKLGLKATDSLTALKAGENGANKVKSDVAVKSADKTKDAVKTEVKSKGGTYTVKAGDTLGKIAQTQLGTTKKWKSLMAANSNLLKDPEDLKVGMVLKLPN